MMPRTMTDFPLRGSALVMYIPWFMVDSFPLLESV
jgi:hypothetical protein